MAAGSEIGGARIANPWRVGGWSLVALIMLAPLVAMRFTSEVKWDGVDFLFMGLLLGSAGLLVELAAWKVRDIRWRVGLCLAVLAAAVLVWADAAVGVF